MLSIPLFYLISHFISKKLCFPLCKVRQFTSSNIYLLYLYILRLCRSNSNQFRNAQLWNDRCTYTYEANHHIVSVIVALALTYLNYAVSILIVSFKV